MEFPMPKLKTALLSALCSLAALAVATPASALPHNAYAPFARIERQQEIMVRAGVRSGELTRRELRQIAAVDARNDRLIAHLRFSGGRLNERERLVALNALNEETRLIQALSHNRRDRGRYS
jgi:hypothetical protein